MESERNPLPQLRGNSIVKCRLATVKINVTHRLCTHRLHASKMACNATRHPHPIWPRHPPRARGAEDYPGRGRRAVWTASDVLQRCRAWDSECFAVERGENQQGIKNGPPQAV